MIIPVKKEETPDAEAEEPKTTLLILRVIRKGKMTNLHLQSARIKRGRTAAVR